MRTKKAKDLRRGDVIVGRDGRGDERVTFNRPSTPGRRFVRTSRTDHHWDSDFPVELAEEAQR